MWNDVKHWRVVSCHSAMFAIYVVVAVGCIDVCPICFWTSARFGHQRSLKDSSRMSSRRRWRWSSLIFFTVLRQELEGLLFAPPHIALVSSIDARPIFTRHTSIKRKEDLHATGLGQSVSASGEKSPPQRPESQATLKLKESICKRLCSYWT